MRPRSERHPLAEPLCAPLNGQCAACLDQVLDDNSAPEALVRRRREQLEHTARLTLGPIRGR